MQITLCIVLLSVCMAMSIAEQAKSIQTQSVDSWVTQCDPTTGAALKLLEPQPTTSVGDTLIDHEKQADVTISLSPTSLLQSIAGYGAGLPQASAKVLYDLKIRNPVVYEEVMTKLFASPAHGGISMSLLRFPIGSCDFSMSNTSYDEVTGDYSLSAFALDKDTEEFVVPVLIDAKRINSQLRLMASPWSAPSWMKKFQSLLGLSNANTLIDDERVYQSYAQFFVKTLDAFAAHDLHIDFLTLQNEPLFGDSPEYPGMYLSAEQELRLAKTLSPLIAERDVKLLGYDHNWDHPEYPQTLLSDAHTPFYGTAWHCYGGEMSSAQEKIHALFPDKPQFVTECTGGYPQGKCDISQGMAQFGFNHEWDMKNILLGAAAHHASSGVKWILALDEHCGPTLPLVSFQNGRPLVAIPSDAKTLQDVQFNQDFYSIAHMSRFVARGAQRVVSQTAGRAASAVLSESFLDPQTALLSTLVMNTDHEHSVSVEVRENGCVVVQDSLPPFSTKIYQWTL